MNRKDDWIIAWAAGFFDGEGSVSLIVHGGVEKYDVYRHLVIAAAQKVPEPLYKFRELFGGSVYNVFPHDSKRILFSWHATTKIAREALVAMLPYLTVKKDKAVLGIEWQDTMKSCNYGRWYHLSEETRNKRLSILSKFYGFTLGARPQLIPPIEVTKEPPTACPHGHPYTAANTYFYLGKYRNCRICHSLRARERNDRLRTQYNSILP